MAADLGTSLSALGLLIGFPLLLLGVLGILGRLEAWMLRPYERAVEIERLLAQEEGAEAVEQAAIRVLAEVDDLQGARTSRRRRVRETAG